MREVFIALEPESPLRTGKVKPKSDYLDTLPYLRGSVLRGAIAEWLKVNGREGEIEKFVQSIRLGNLFPSSDGDIIPLPFPMTAIECKTQGGFLCEGGHGIRDSLLIAIAYTELKKLGAIFPVPMSLRCRKCKGRMERVSGFYTQKGDCWQKVSVELAMQTKVALSRYRRASQEQMLYRVIALRPKQAFVGRVRFEDEDAFSVLCEAVENMGVGALTTRGFGKVKLRKSKASLMGVSERLRQFNEKLEKVWFDLADLAKQVGSQVPDKPVGTYFSVDLLSPAILHDENGLPTLKLKLLLNGQLLEPVFWSTQPEFVGGWSTAWGLPKPTSLGAAMGSVYVFRTEQTVDEIVEKLETLEANGVGERTDEGLGEILVCHPFHLEVEQT
ncbi:MAG: CRISPR-associated RAMP protein Csx10 [Armatimonadetes bacterium]|nr:CRISPR-associated RAMP protein Csx10 [Armatimonadota bacterium]MCX7969353.1 CRISPR-associated RAMP protein Csx10 [Armatimonadota bacterium]MDW8028167.1 CRISPR-associated RAMP protein Csx10 [Armatimonadota bacterium]